MAKSLKSLPRRSRTSTRPSRPSLFVRPIAARLQVCSPKAALEQGLPVKFSFGLEQRFLNFYARITPPEPLNLFYEDLWYVS